MSELIDNGQRLRQQKLKALILSLHHGKDIEVAKEEFKREFGQISTLEISQMEQSLIAEDGITVAEIQKLCDVHASLFEGGISDIHNTLKGVTSEKGHPVQVMKEENERIEKLIEEEIKPYLSQSGKTAMLMLRVAFDRLWEIDKHYQRKELLMFPHLEKKGITAPPKVMWGVDDEIRADIKEVIALLNQIGSDENIIKQKVEGVIARVQDMIFKENNILIPLLESTLKFVHWVSVDLASDEIGYFLEKPAVAWNKEGNHEEQPISEEAIDTTMVKVGVGALSIEQLNGILNSVPIDMTFVDKEGYVRYFSQGKERIFPRPATILGRHVTMCHPPGSVHVVEKIIQRLQSGEKESEDFWIKMGNIMVLIRYLAIKDAKGNFIGILETTQNIKPLRDLEGEKRLAD